MFSKTCYLGNQESEYKFKLQLGSSEAYIYYMIVDIMNSFLCYSSHCVSLPTASLSISKNSCCDIREMY